MSAHPYNPYNLVGFCHMGGHFSEELHIRTKSCRECECLFMKTVDAHRRPGQRH